MIMKSANPVFSRNRLKIIDGATDILLVVPHGVETRPMDDINTAALAAATAGRLQCAAVINDSIRKRDIDFNQISQAAQYDFFINALHAAADAPGPTLVVWIHGIGNQNIRKATPVPDIKDAILGLIGYGQTENTDARNGGSLTATHETVEKIIDAFGAYGLRLCAADVRSNYCGRGKNNMNQWFRKKQYALSRVSSIQIEFRMKGVREPGCIDATAEKMAGGLSDAIRNK